MKHIDHVNKYSSCPLKAGPIPHPVNGRNCFPIPSTKLDGTIPIFFDFAHIVGEKWYPNVIFGHPGVCLWILGLSSPLNSLSSLLTLWSIGFLFFEILHVFKYTINVNPLSLYILQIFLVLSSYFNFIVTLLHSNIFLSCHIYLWFFHGSCYKEKNSHLGFAWKVISVPILKMNSFYFLIIPLYLCFVLHLSLECSLIHHWFETSYIYIWSLNII